MPLPNIVVIIKADCPTHGLVHVQSATAAAAAAGAVAFAHHIRSEHGQRHGAHRAAAGVAAQVPRLTLNPIPGLTLLSQLLACTVAPLL